MQRVSYIRGSNIAMDRDYPPEIIAARKRLWPEFKRLRSRRENVKMKYPAAILLFGEVLRDEFPD